MNPNESITTKGVEILIVEDSPTQALQVQHFLEQHDYRVSVVFNGRDALAWLMLHRAALIISDVVMPEMDGYELCRRIRKEQELESIPVILLTALSDAKDVLRGLECGADNFIVKPYDRAYLLSQVRSTLRYKHSCSEEKAETTVEIDFEGQKYFIDASRQKILNLLLSTYETAVQKNLELNHTQNELKLLNEQLEEKVNERTAALKSEIVEHRESEQRLRQIMENVREVFWMASHDLTQLIYVSPAYEQVFGRSSESLHAEPGSWMKAVHADDFERVHRIVTEKGLAGLSLEYRIVRPGGSARWVSDRRFPIQNQSGEIYRIGGIIEDITERKEAEEKIDKAKTMLQTVFDGISEPLLMVERDLTVKMLNEASCRYFQIPSGEEAIGKSCYELASESCVSCTDCTIRSAISEKKSISFERKGLFDPELIEHITVYPAQETSSGFSGAIIRICDVTESKNMEKHLIRADRLASLGQLSGGIAHEIRNPLAGINLFVDLLSDQQKFSRTGQELNILGEIKNNIGKMDGIIKRILNFARQSETTLTNLQVGLLIEETIKFWHSRINKERIKLKLSLEEELPDIAGDAIEIQQVLNNLVQNSIEAMKGGGTLDILARKGAFCFDKRRPAVNITIRDSGPGIPAKHQDSIFNPFFTTKPTGTGLGLAISHRIVSRHGGFISFESLPNEGTTFTVELPAVPNTDPLRQAPPQT